MNWDAIGAIGESIGAIAVFVTLIYLAMQIRQNTRSVQASAVDSAISQVNQIRERLISDREVTNLYRRGNEDPASLDDEDIIRYRLLIHNILLAESNVFHQAEFTGLSESTWKTQIPIVERVVSNVGGRWFWENHRNEFEESFRKLIDDILTNDSDS